jgi:hypothetical protein
MRADTNVYAASVIGHRTSSKPSSIYNCTLLSSLEAITRQINLCGIYHSKTSFKPSSIHSRTLLSSFEAITRQNNLCGTYHSKPSSKPSSIHSCTLLSSLEANGLVTLSSACITCQINHMSALHEYITNSLASVGLKYT